jgi:hypothetical protein
MANYVEFDQAKWLKEIGFDEECTRFFVKPNCKVFGIDEHGRYYPIKNKSKELYIVGNVATQNFKNVILAPEHWQVVEWLRVHKGIWVSVDWITRVKPFNSGFYCHLRGTLHKLNEDNFIVINNTLDPGYEIFNSPKEAYSASFDYIKENKLI